MPTLQLQRPRLSTPANKMPLNVTSGTSPALRPQGLLPASATRFGSATSTSTPPQLGDTCHALDHASGGWRGSPAHGAQLPGMPDWRTRDPDAMRGSAPGGEESMGPARGAPPTSRGTATPEPPSSSFGEILWARPTRQSFGQPSADQRDAREEMGRIPESLRQPAKSGRPATSPLKAVTKTVSFKTPLPPSREDARGRTPFGRSAARTPFAKKASIFGQTSPHITVAARRRRSTGGWSSTSWTCTRKLQGSCSKSTRRRRQRPSSEQRRLRGCLRQASA